MIKNNNSYEEKMNYCCLSDQGIINKILDWQICRGISEQETYTAFNDIYIYGREIIDSDYYKKAFNQTHHYVSSVGEHTLHVTLYSLSLCYKLQALGYDISTRNVVIASLCHDLGIIGRYEKFANNLVCCYLHPIHSLLIARELVHYLSPDVKRAISRHMFPATLIPPTSFLGFILIISDKTCTFFEVYDKRTVYAPNAV